MSTARRAGTDDPPEPALNVLVAVGRLNRPPDEVALPSGTVMARFDLTVRLADEPAESMPVVWFDPPARALTLDTGRPVLVVGRVRRRFHRGGGALRSSTEVVATTVAPLTGRAGRRRAVALLDAALAELGP